MINFTCANCGSETTLVDAAGVPRNRLCPPCHFLGVDWQDDPDKLAFVEEIQRKHELH